MQKSDEEHLHTSRRVIFDGNRRGVLIIALKYLS